MKNITEKQFIELKLKQALINAGISHDYYTSILTYLNLLMQENENLNLISRNLDIEQIISDHIYDCLIGAQYFIPNSSITDLGTGAGLPGILLAIIFPEKHLQLVEKSPKKCIFLNKAIKILKLKNINLYEGLATEFKISSQVLTCRGFKDILSIIAMTEPFFNRQGVYILYKGKFDKINEELDLVKKHYKINVEILKLNAIKEKERHILLLKKK
jgi:16S rRNA (guanine527-N7)-methyltransferase